jgi:hypothetical protein
MTAPASKALTLQRPLPDDRSESLRRAKKKDAV